MTIKNAGKNDAADLAYLINMAGEGIPQYLWSEMAEEGQSSMEVGRIRAAREEGGFSYKNARVLVESGVLQGMIISYKQPDPYKIDDIEEYPEIVKPLVQLEAKAPGSWYINAIATYESYQGKGVAQQLLAEAEEQALTSRVREMSLIVASENTRAARLYQHIGYKIKSSLPVIEYPGCMHGGDWLLMIKRLNRS